MKKLEGITPLVQIRRNRGWQPFPQLFPAVIIFWYACCSITYTEQQTHKGHAFMWTYGKIKNLLTGKAIPQRRLPDHAVLLNAGYPWIIDKIHRSSLRIMTPSSSSQYSFLSGLMCGAVMEPFFTSRQPSIS